MFAFLFLLDFTSFESQTPECSAVWVPQATESRSVEVSPAEAPAGVEGPRGWSYIFPEREHEKEEGGCADSVFYRRHA